VGEEGAGGLGGFCGCGLGGVGGGGGGTGEFFEEVGVVRLDEVGLVVGGVAGHCGGVEGRDMDV
jgi:hypothetical protein